MVYFTNNARNKIVRRIVNPSTVSRRITNPSYGQVLKLFFDRDYACRRRDTGKAHGRAFPVPMAKEPGGRASGYFLPLVAAVTNTGTLGANCEPSAVWTMNQ